MVSSAALIIQRMRLGNRNMHDYQARYVDRIPDSIWRWMASIPDGEATLLGALATLLGALFVILAAVIAWKSVQRQIASAESIEKARQEHEVKSIEAGFSAELMAYSSAIIIVTSQWNKWARSLINDDFLPPMPMLIDPLYYRANIGQIGTVRHQWVAGAIITFHANLVELNEISKDVFDHKANRPEPGVTARRLQIMAANLSQAIDGLNADFRFPIPPEIQIDKLIMPNGTRLDHCRQVPRSIQEVLQRLAGIEWAGPQRP